MAGLLAIALLAVTSRFLTRADSRAATPLYNTEAVTRGTLQVRFCEEFVGD